VKRQLEPSSVTTPVRTLQRGLGYQANRYSLEWNAALALALPQHTVRSSPNIPMLVAIREHGACSKSKLKFGNLITIAMFAWSYRIAAYMYSIGNQLPPQSVKCSKFTKKKKARSLQSLIAVSPCQTRQTGPYASRDPYALHIITPQFMRTKKKGNLYLLLTQRRKEKR